MESFFLAETVKYLYLLFDAGASGPPAPGALPRGHNFVDQGAHGYVFNTEGHMLPLRPEWRTWQAASAPSSTGGEAAAAAEAEETSEKGEAPFPSSARLEAVLLSHAEGSTTTDSGSLVLR